MVEPRNPFMGPRRRRLNVPDTNDNTTNLGDTLDSVVPLGRQGGSSRTRRQPINRQTRPGTTEITSVQQEFPNVTQQTKPIKNDSFLEAFIKLINSVLRFKGK